MFNVIISRFFSVLRIDTNLQWDFDLCKHRHRPTFAHSISMPFWLFVSSYLQFVQLISPIVSYCYQNDYFPPIEKG